MIRSEAEDLPATLIRGVSSEDTETTMSVMTPIFAGLWDHYIFWSLIVGGFAFGWLYHHSFWFTYKDGEKLQNVYEIKIGVFPKHNDDFRQRKRQDP